MGKQLIKFNDGSILEWEDRETIRYTNGEYSALIWVDYEPGFFSRGRIIKSSSIDNWESHPKDISQSINETDKLEIIEKIQNLYKKQKRKCIVEEE